MYYVYVEKGYTYRNMYYVYLENVIHLDRNMYFVYL